MCFAEDRLSKNVFKSKTVFACLDFLITVSQLVLYQYCGLHQYGETGGPLPRGAHTKDGLGCASLLLQEETVE